MSLAERGMKKRTPWPYFDLLLWKKDLSSFLDLKSSSFYRIYLEVDTGWYRRKQKYVIILFIFWRFLRWKWNITGILNTVYIFRSNSHQNKWPACPLQAGADNRLLLQVEIHVQFNCWLEDVISTGPPGSWVVGVGLGFYSSVEVAEFQGRLQLASRANFLLLHPVFYLSPTAKHSGVSMRTWMELILSLLTFKYPFYVKSKHRGLTNSYLH